MNSPAQESEIDRLRARVRELEASYDRLGQDWTKLAAAARALRDAAEAIVPANRPITEEEMCLTAAIVALDAAYSDAWVAHGLTPPLTRCWLAR